ncbi:MAG: phospho-N-acetylmuramoyl-pentapeptide-transferase [Omnitrophica WOR_2 bacterium RIFCSPHIGHO2_02_FULL_68_15]|nr:MAG: phospho-N-acetylmuramoyl-pentapeptide-transferase [Omnitrophica WOR_2 bacterium RIFCSPHIGHO2_02_FULL_68_15]
MFYHFLYPLRDLFFGFNVFRYITFRAASAGITAFLVCILIGPRLIRALHRLNVRQGIKRDGFSKLYGAHEQKEKIPTMGGILILGALVASVLLWGDLANPYLLTVTACTIWLGAVGFVDDFLKITKKDCKGLRAGVKFALQAVPGLGVGMFLFRESPSWTLVSVPFLKDFFLALGIFYVPFTALVIIGSSNAVNLTDGLDGLAIGCTVTIATAFAIFSYIAGNAIFSRYLHVPFVPGAGELTVVCAAIFGAGLGFLWYNSHPASVFMGDTGSLSLGGALGGVAVFTKKELLLVVIGGVLVAEALSVIAQVASYKIRKKRIFLMAPIHHHFQLQGLTESKVVIRFWIVSIILALWGLASLKLQ